MIFFSPLRALAAGRKLPQRSIPGLTLQPSFVRGRDVQARTQTAPQGGPNACPWLLPPASAAKPTPDPGLGQAEGGALYQVNRSRRCRREEEHGVKFMATTRTVWRSLEAGSAVILVMTSGSSRC